MNNKGFAITGIIYTTFILFLLILLSIMGNLRFKNKLLQKAILSYDDIFIGDCSEINKEDATVDGKIKKTGIYEFKYFTGDNSDNDGDDVVEPGSDDAGEVSDESDDGDNDNGDVGDVTGDEYEDESGNVEVGGTDSSESEEGDDVCYIYLYKGSVLPTNDADFENVYFSTSNCNNLKSVAKFEYSGNVCILKEGE